MSIRDDVDGLTDLDAAAEGVIVFFNPTDESVEHVDDSMTGAPVVLHPVLAESVDATVRSASFDRRRVPSRYPPAPQQSSSTPDRTRRHPWQPQS